MNGYVYILKDSNHKFYVGSTNDISRRIAQHLAGHTHSTRRMKELKLVFFQKFDSLKDARSVESKIKRMKRKDYIEKMISEGEIRIKPE